MKAKFISKDEKEINRLARSLDMASFIFQLTHNSRKYYFDEDGEKAWQRVLDLLEEYNINIDDLIE